MSIRRKKTFEDLNFSLRYFGQPNGSTLFLVKLVIIRKKIGLPLSMRLNNKMIRLNEEIRQFLITKFNRFISDPRYSFCLDLQHENFGLSDFPYVAKSQRTELSFLAIFKEIERKDIFGEKIDGKQYLEEAKHILESIRMYLLEMDPVQAICEEGIKVIEKIEE